VVLLHCSPNKCHDKNAPLLAGAWDTLEVAIFDDGRIMIWEDHDTSTGYTTAIVCFRMPCPRTVQPNIKGTDILNRGPSSSNILDEPHLLIYFLPLVLQSGFEILSSPEVPNVMQQGKVVPSFIVNRSNIRTFNVTSAAKIK